VVKIGRQPVLLLAIPCVTRVLEQALFLGEKPWRKGKKNKNPNLHRNYDVKTAGLIQKAELVFLW